MLRRHVNFTIGVVGYCASSNLAPLRLLVMYFTPFNSLAGAVAVGHLLGSVNSL